MTAGILVVGGIIATVMLVCFIAYVRHRQSRVASFPKFVDENGVGGALFPEQFHLKNEEPLSLDRLEFPRNRLTLLHNRVLGSSER